MSKNNWKRESIECALIFIILILSFINSNKIVDIILNLVVIGLGFFMLKFPDKPLDKKTQNISERSFIKRTIHKADIVWAYIFIGAGIIFLILDIMALYGNI